MNILDEKLFFDHKKFEGKHNIYWIGDQYSFLSFLDEKDKNKATNEIKIQGQIVVLDQTTPNEKKS